MSGTDETFHYTNERHPQARIPAPADAESSHLKVPPKPPTNSIQLTPPPQSIIDTKPRPKDEIIAERQAGLPLPEQPPVASDWHSADGRTVNVGSGRVSSDVSHGGGSESGLRGPATGESSVRADGEEGKTNTPDLSGVGRQGMDGLEGLPEDALAKEG